MTIGENIRKLRRERDITQEALAEMLGVTAQSISQWENSRTAPDISQIAPLAHIFEVSADVILGIDVEKKTEQIEKLWQAAYDVACTGDHVQAISMLGNALRQYPDSFKLMGLYTDEIYMYNHLIPEDMQEQNKERALGYLERILSDCTDMSIRNNALTTACMWYPKIGRTEEAVEMAKSIDIGFSSAELLGKIYTGKKQFKALQDAVVVGVFHGIGYDLERLLDTTNDEGIPMYTSDEKLELYQFSADIFLRLLPDGDYYFYAQFIECAYRNMTWVYAERQDRENILFCMRRAAEMAIHFDTYTPGTLHTSPLVRGQEADGIWWHDGHNRSHDWLEALETREAYDFVRDDPAFGEILALLRKTAK